DGIRDDLVTGVQTCALPILVGGAEACFQSLAAVLNSVDGFLRLLDANSHLERFWRHGNAAVPKHLIGVASAVANRQHDNIGRDIDRKSTSLNSSHQIISYAV